MGLKELKEWLVSFLFEVGYQEKDSLVELIEIANLAELEEICNKLNDNICLVLEENERIGHIY